jgi:hypothetical protein
MGLKADQLPTTERRFKLHGYLKNFSLGSDLLLIKDNVFTTFLKAHISANRC